MIAATRNSVKQLGYRGLGQFEMVAFPKLLTLRFMAKPPKRPRDSAQLAKFITEIASGERPNDKPRPTSEAATMRGKARAKALSPKKRSAIAKKAAKARWRKR